MFIIQINDYTKTNDKTMPSITYSDDMYTTYDAAKLEINDLVLNALDNYKDVHTTFDLVSTKEVDAKIINAFGEIDYEYIIMELVRKIPI